MKLVILGDTHFGMRNDSPIFHDLCRDFYGKLLFPYMEKHGIDTIMQLGDLFDRRKFINFNTLYQCREYFFDVLKQKHYKMMTLLGNHDVYWKNTLDVNSTGLLLKEYSNIHVVSKPSTYKFDDYSVDIIPWICEDNVESIQQFIKESSSRLCLGHFELSGYEMDIGNYCHDGYDAVNLQKYELVITGHFHHRSIRNNIAYVGTPTEMTWADCDDPRGFHVFDTETFDLTFIQNPYTIHRKIYYNDSKLFYDDVLVQDFSEYKNKYVKLIVTEKKKDIVFDTFVDRLTKAGPHDVNIIEDFTDTSITSGETIDEADDTMTILDKYIENAEVDVDKNKLKSILREVYTEALANGA